MKRVFRIISGNRGVYPLSLKRLGYVPSIAAISVFLVSCATLTGSDEESASSNNSSLPLSERYPDSPGYSVLESRMPPIIPGFRRVEINAPGMAFTAENASLESFDSWHLIRPIMDRGRYSSFLTAAEEDQMARLAMEAARRQMLAARFEMVESPTPCTVTAQLRLANLELFKSGTSASQYNYVSSLGSYDVLVEVREAESKELIFFYVTNVEMGGGSTSSKSPNLSRFFVTIIDTVKDVPGFIEILAFDENKIGERSEFGCKGAIGKRWQELME